MQLKFTEIKINFREHMCKWTAEEGVECPVIESNLTENPNGNQLQIQQSELRAGRKCPLLPQMDENSVDVPSWECSNHTYDASICLKKCQNDTNSVEVVKCICTDIDCNWKHKGEICHDTVSSYRDPYHSQSYGERNIQRAPLPAIQYNPHGGVSGPRGTWGSQQTGMSSSQDEKINLDNGHWSNPSFYANQPRPPKPRIFK